MLPPPLQGSLPAGWLAFTARELNPLDRDEGFQITSSSCLPGLFPGATSANLHRSGRTASGTLRPKNQSARVRSDRVLALSPDQHADCEQIENVGADADGERGPVISELVVKEAGDSPHGGHCT